MVTFSVATRNYPVTHPETKAPLCQTCTDWGFFFFNPGCKTCLEILRSPLTKINQIFAIIRQWVPQVQRNIELLGSEIIRRGAHPDDRDGMTDMTLLHYCCKAGCPDINPDSPGVLRLARRLINLGCDVYVRSSSTGMNALHFAAFFDSIQMVSLLIMQNPSENYVNSTCPDMDDFTSLHITCNKVNVESSKVLLKGGADTLAKDSKGRTPLDVIPEVDEEALEDAERLRNLLSNHNAFQLPKWDTPTYEGVCSKVVQLQLGLEIGERVVTKEGSRGVLRYLGTTEFAKGIYAGIELDEDGGGRNDGSVNGINYFVTFPHKGIFLPVSKVNPENEKKRAVSAARRLIQSRKSSAQSKPKFYSNPVSAGTSQGTSRSTSPTSQIVFNQSLQNMGRKKKSSNRLGSETDLKSANEPSSPKFSLPASKKTSTESVAYLQDVEFFVGDKVIVKNKNNGVIKFVGVTKFAQGTWYGVELEKPVGKNNGTVDGVKYFQTGPLKGLFVQEKQLKHKNSKS